MKRAGIAGLILMERSEREAIISMVTVLPILLASVFAAIDRVPEGYEAPITVYFACGMISLIIATYDIFLNRDRRWEPPTALLALLVVAFAVSGYKDRRLVRWTQRFPNDPIIVQVSSFLSLPAILFDTTLRNLGLEIPWVIGLSLEVFLVLGFWEFLRRRTIDAHPLSPTNSDTYLDLHTIQKRPISRGKITLSLLFLVLFSASIRIIPSLYHQVPEGVDTPFYVAALQGRIPSEYFGGSLRRILYYLFLVFGAVLDLPFPIPLSLIVAVKILPVLAHTIITVLIFNFTHTCFGDLKTSIIAGVFAATSIGLMRITWDLYKLLFSIPFVLLAFQQAAKTMRTQEPKSFFMTVIFLAIGLTCHPTIGGLAFLTLSSFVTIETFFGNGILMKSKLVFIATLCLLVIIGIFGSIAENALFSGWGVGNLTAPLPSRPEVGIISLSELFLWLRVSPLLFAILGLIYLRRADGVRRLPSIWFLVCMLIIEQALFHTYTNTGQIHRTELLTSMPTAILAAVGLMRVISPLWKVKRKTIGRASALTFLLVSILSVTIVAYGYAGFISSQVIQNAEFISMTWLLEKAPNTNCGVPTNLDSWTGYYGQIQNRELPTTFYIDRTATDDSPLYNRIYSGFNRIYLRTDLI